ncbi:MAG: hypothetical protein KJN71_04375 [Acidimicrobiia bacterium]|nr:hypothetical protein [Acidimicrobiia bacterium]NNC76039.1 hypothetical protein [Acidimicrobiia bacterium]
MAGLEPRGFTWVISGRLAMCERIGGYGFQHRRVRREEEIIWLQDEGFTTVVSLLQGNQNITAYEAAGMRAFHRPLPNEIEDEDVDAVFVDLDAALESTRACVLVHSDLIDDVLVGLLGGYLVHAGLIEDPIVATSVIQEIAKRAIGPEGRRLIGNPS